ncbi:MAG TPA: PEGA domain-containing protein [Polyangiaceae bacterium]|nr:PEGA domain-containing protein [Polyangiaceae bacterium]
MKSSSVTLFGSQLVTSLLIFSLAHPLLAAGNSAAAKHAKPKASPRASATVPAVVDPAVAVAAAEAHSKAEALTLKNQGDALFRQREFGSAISSYQQSYALFPDARVLFNQARALQALGRYSEALQFVQRFADVASPELKAEVPGLPELQADLRSRVGEVVIHVSQPDARVTFRNQPLSISAGTPLAVDAGEGLLRVTKEGFFPYERQISVRGGSSASFEVTLGSVEREAQVVVKSRVAGAAVSIDGKPLAQAPTEAFLLPGTHRIVAHREGYADASTQVILVPGQRRELELNPLEQHPLLAQWWFWAGAAVVVAAGVTTTILVTRSDEGTNGDFSPSIISGPLRF